MSRAIPPLIALLISSAALAGIPAALASEPPVYTEDFESGAAGWIAEGLWHLSTVTGSTSFWYGQEETGNYDTGAANAGRLYSPPIDLTAYAGDALVLSFFEQAAHEGNCNYEQPMIEISIDGGAPFLLDQRCVVEHVGLVQVPLVDAAGSVIQLAFVWDTKDAIDNHFFGWSIDDLSIAQGETDLASAGSSHAADDDGAYLVTFVSNLGSTDATGVSVSYELYDASSVLVAAGSVITDVPAGAIVQADLGDFVLAPGVYSLTTTVDPANAIEEADEANNVAVYTFELFSATPNLFAFHEADSSIPSGSLLFVDYNAHNDGSASTTNDFALRFEVYDSFGFVVASEEVTFGPVCAGCTGSETFETILSDGQYTLVTTADPYGSVAESNENDNVFVTQLVVGGSGASDLIISQFGHTPDPAMSGDFVTLYAEVMNVGGTTTGSTTLGMYVAWPDGTLEQFAELDVGPLAPGMSTFVEFPVGNVPEGVYDLYAYIDIYDSEFEAEEFNNEAFHTLVVGSTGTTANLAAGAFAHVPEEGDVVLEATVANTGAEFTPDTDVMVLLNGIVVEHVGIPALAPGETFVVAVPRTLGPGSYVLDVVVDSTNMVLEADEADNMASYAFFVEENVAIPADLAVTILGVDRSPVRTDLGDLGLNPIGRRTVVVSACNLGELPLTGGELLVSLESAAPKDLIESSIMLGAFEIPALEGGECATFHARWDAAGSVGDVDIVARGFSPDEVEGDPTNDEDVYADFVLVGGFGGVVLI